MPLASSLLFAVTLLSAGLLNAEKTNPPLVVAFTQELLNLDYLHTTKREYIILSDLIDETLFHLNPNRLNAGNGSEYEPNLATHYDYHAEALTIDVTLRQDVTFHDGSPFSADDVLYTYNYVLNDKTNKPHRSVSTWLKRVEKTGLYTLTFHLHFPYALAIRDMARRIRIRQNGSYGTPYNKSAQATQLNGLGPYKVKRFIPGKEVILERYDGYFKGPKGRPAIQSIKLRSIPDLGTQQAEIFRGSVHWIYNVPYDIAKNVGKTGRADHVSGDSMRVAFIPLDAHGYTGADNPLTHLKVRQALNHAINREIIVKYLVGGSGQPIHAACHPIQFGCPADIKIYEYNPEKAQQLLAEAGYPNGFPLTLWAYRDKPVAETVAADLRKIGVIVNLRYGKLNALNKARKARKVPAYLGTWASGGTADAASIANIHWSDTSDRNLSGDAQITAWLDQAERTTDASARKALYAKAFHRIADQAYWIPLHVYSQNYLVSKTLDFPVHKDGLPRLYTTQWK